MPRRAGDKIERGKVVAYVIDLLASWLIDVQHVFSSFGLFGNSLMFGAIVRDVLHVKNPSDYETAGVASFCYRGRAKPIALGYHATPGKAFDGDILAAWTEKAYAVYAVAVAKGARGRQRMEAGDKRMARGGHY